MANAETFGRESAALTAAGDTTAGAVLALENDSGEDRIITGFYLDITTQSTGAAAVDAGVAADGTTSNDTLLDGASVAAATVLDLVKNAGTNGAGARRWNAGDFITITASADATGLVGTAYVEFFVV